MSTEENKATIRRFIEQVWGKGDYALEQQLLAPDFVDHNPIPGMAPDRAGHHQAVEMFQKSVPDLDIKVDLLIAEGDMVVDHWVCTGTQTGEMMGIPPTNKPFTITGMDITRIENGKIKEIWHQEDTMGMMVQIGAIPAPGQPQRRAA